MWNPALCQTIIYRIFRQSSKFRDNLSLSGVRVSMLFSGIRREQYERSLPPGWPGVRHTTGKSERAAGTDCATCRLLPGRGHCRTNHLGQVLCLDWDWEVRRYMHTGRFVLNSSAVQSILSSQLVGTFRPLCDMLGHLWWTLRIYTGHQYQCWSIYNLSVTKTAPEMKHMIKRWS